MHAKLDDIIIIVKLHNFMYVIFILLYYFERKKKKTIIHKFPMALVMKLRTNKSSDFFLFFFGPNLILQK